ncbi:hypothetical protein [Halegenticoccus soli]|uniref:hypothetical protein n=1 Tax=Halegenticoccus soli TaxID=1985678 RepID=UPI00117BA8A5|nr:hypothetical protein [Halegenticoccus soli]
MGTKTHVERRSVHWREPLTRTIQRLTGVTGILRNAVLLLLHALTMLFSSKRHQRLIVFSVVYIGLLLVGVSYLLTTHISVVVIPLTGRIETMDYFHALVAILSAPVFGIAVEISREYLSDGHAHLPRTSWVHRTAVGVEIIAILLSLYFVTDLLIEALLGPVVVLTRNIWIGIAGPTIGERLALHEFVASMAGFYLWGAIFFYYIRRERLSDLLPLTKYSGVFFSRDYAVLGLAITLSGFGSVFTRFWFVNLVIAPIYSAVEAINPTMGLVFGVLSLTLADTLVYFCVFFIPLCLVGMTARSVEKFTTQWPCLCDTTVQTDLSDFASENPPSSRSG